MVCIVATFGSEDQKTLLFKVVATKRNLRGA